jgi:hypothetical protein
MTDNKAKGSQTHPLLRSILEKALRAGAEAITLEYVDEGLEVCYESGHLGIGEIVEDPESEAQIIGAVVDLAGLQYRSRGTMRIEVLGEMRTIAVQAYDSFGESAFRLILRRPERKRGRRS